MTVHKEEKQLLLEKADESSAVSETESQSRKFKEECFSICKDPNGSTTREGGKGKSQLEGTNLDCENLITVETCICAVVRWTLKKGSDKFNGKTLGYHISVVEKSSRLVTEQKYIIYKQRDIHFIKTDKYGSISRTQMTPLSNLVSHLIVYESVPFNVSLSLPWQPNQTRVAWLFAA